MRTCVISKGNLAPSFFTAERWRNRPRLTGFLWQFGAALETFARKEIEGSKRRSVRLFHGQIGFRTKAATFAVTADAVALVWTRENLPGVLRLDRRALADVLAVTEGGTAVIGETGEVLPFVTPQAAEDVFFVR